MLRSLSLASFLIASQALAAEIPISISALDPWGLDACHFTGCWIDAFPNMTGYQGFGFTVDADTDVWTGRTLHFFCSNGSHVTLPMAQTYPNRFTSSTFANPCGENAVSKISMQMGMQGQFNDNLFGTVAFWAVP